MILCYAYYTNVSRATLSLDREITWTTPGGEPSVSKRFKLIKRQHCVNTQRFICISFQSIYITEDFHFFSSFPFNEFEEEFSLHPPRRHSGFS